MKDRVTGEDVFMFGMVVALAVGILALVAMSGFDRLVDSVDRMREVCAERGEP